MLRPLTSKEVFRHNRSFLIFSFIFVIFVGSMGIWAALGVSENSNMNLPFGLPARPTVLVLTMIVMMVFTLSAALASVFGDRNKLVECGVCGKVRAKRRIEAEKKSLEKRCCECFHEIND